MCPYCIGNNNAVYYPPIKHYAVYKSNLLTMNFLNVVIHLIIICINLMFSLSYQQERSACQEWRRDWRKKLHSGIAMTLYIMLIVAQLYSYEKIKSKDI